MYTQGDSLFVILSVAKNLEKLQLDSSSLSFLRMTGEIIVILNAGMWYNVFGKKSNDKMTKERTPKTMPKGQRKDYSKEFKLSAVHLMKSKLFKPKEVFEMLGGKDRQTVYRWIKEYDEKGESAFDPNKSVLPARELNRLKIQLADAKMENEILKKATAYFAKQNEKK